MSILNANLDDILCLKTERTVAYDNCFSYQGKSLQIPKVKSRCHYANAKVLVHEYADQRITVFHGPRLLATYTSDGVLEVLEEKLMATG